MFGVFKLPHRKKSCSRPWVLPCSVPSNVFKVPKSAVNTFDGTDPKVHRIKPKVWNTIFFSVFLTVFDGPNSTTRPSNAVSVDTSVETSSSSDSPGPVFPCRDHASSDQNVAPMVPLLQVSRDRCSTKSLA